MSGERNDILADQLSVLQHVLTVSPKLLNSSLHVSNRDKEFSSDTLVHLRGTVNR